MKRIFFVLFLLFSSNLFAKQDFNLENQIDNNAENLLHMNINLKKMLKTRIKILKPCVYVENEMEINSPIYKNIDKTEYNIKKEIDEIDDLISTIEKNKKEDEDLINDSLTKILEKIVKKTRTYENLISENYINIINKIYNKIYSNLVITDIYDISYDENACNSINDYFLLNNANDISEYIFSDNLNSYDYVVSTDLFIIKDNEIKVEVSIWDIVDEKFVNGKYYILNTDKNTDNSYRISNIISDLILQTTTGEIGNLFDTKLIYISETGDAKNRQKQVTIMNFDGTKNTRITKNKNLKLTPIFSKNNREEVFYLEYVDNQAYVFKYNLNIGKLSKIINNQVMTSAPAFNPNKSNQIILSGTDDNSDTNLILFDLDRMVNRKITNISGINTSASFSPDGKKIVFVSDRSGSRKLYVKDLETGDEKLISKDKGIYDKPSWSPDGKLISFIKISRGKFYLGMMTYSGDDERYLISDYLIEGVRWTPNSRYLLYTKQTGAFGIDSIPKLYIIDVLTKNEIKLNVPEFEGASDPDMVVNY